MTADEERAKVVAWLREQAAKGASIAREAGQGTTRRAAFGGGSYALHLAAREIEALDHHKAGAGDEK
jgi:hypothetical protein